MKNKYILLVLIFVSYILSWYLWGQQKLIESEIDYALSDFGNYEPKIERIVIINYNSFIFTDSLDFKYKNVHILSSNYLYDSDSAGYNQYYKKITDKYKTNFLIINDSYLNLPPIYFGQKTFWEYGTDSVFDKNRICIWFGFIWLEYEFSFWPWE